MDSRYAKIKEYEHKVKNILLKHNIKLRNDFIVEVENGKVVNKHKYVVKYTDASAYRIVLSEDYADKCIDLSGKPRFAYVGDLFFTLYKGVGCMYYDNYLKGKRLGLEGEGEQRVRFADTFAYIMCTDTPVAPVLQATKDRSIVDTYKITKSNYNIVINTLSKNSK